ncbi:MAG: hypothetical protein V2A79_11870 [Planctomycetota bacterium]
MSDTLTLALVAGLAWCIGCEKSPSAPPAPARESIKPGAQPPVEESAPGAKREPLPPVTSPDRSRASRPDESPPPQPGTEVVEERWPNGGLKSQQPVKRGPDGTTLPHGTYRSWYEDGQPKARGEFADGKHEGVWTYWHSNGQKKGEGAWHNDRIQGRWTYWYDNGQKKAESGWVDGAQHGDYTSWYESGKKAEEGHFVEGKAHGLFITWNRDGTSYAETRFEHGKKVEEKKSPTGSQPAGGP